VDNSAVWPDLFGRALLVRQWGRIGTEGYRRLDPYPDPDAALNALAQLLRIKRRRGYQDHGTNGSCALAGSSPAVASSRCNNRITRCRRSAVTPCAGSGTVPALRRLVLVNCRLSAVGLCERHNGHRGPPCVLPRGPLPDQQPRPPSVVELLAERLDQQPWWPAQRLDGLIPLPVLPFVQQHGDPGRR
jgi:predicted DNA-binding WGR domain protein